MNIQRLEKDGFTIETNMTLLRIGDFLVTVESHLQALKRSDFSTISNIMGANEASKRMVRAHHKRFDRDMSRALRYSAVISLYSLFETIAKRFELDFKDSYPGKKPFVEVIRNHQKDGFVRNFQRWLEMPPTRVRIGRTRIWSLLDDLRIIRNCITHVNGDLSLDPNTTNVMRIREVVGRTRKIHFDAKGVLIVDSGFALEVLDRLHTFFRLLFKAAGYGIKLPPGSVESFSKSFEGFEEEIAKKMAAYEARQTMNLGGPFTDPPQS